MKILKTILCSILFSSAAYGIVGHALVLSDQSNATSGETTTSFKLQERQGKSSQGVIFRLEANNDSGSAPTLDVTVQHSPDCSTWKDLFSFTQVTTETNNVEDVHLTSDTTLVFACLRAVTTLGGSSPQYDYTITAYVD